MDRLMPTISVLMELAEKNAKDVVGLEASGGDSQARHAEQLTAFQQTWQPRLSDKEYTALYRNYVELFMTCVKNELAPGSAVPKELITAESIMDGEEIYRPNPHQMEPTKWTEHLQAVEKMAQRFAQEFCVLAANGGDTEKISDGHRKEAAAFAVEHHLTVAEMDAQGRFYSEKYIEALKRETEIQVRQNNERNDLQRREMSEPPEWKKNSESVRETVQLMVDDFYRTVFLYQGKPDQMYLERQQNQFVEKLDRYLLQFPVADRESLVEFISQIRDKNSNDCENDPINFRKRLGTPRGGVDQPQSHRQGLGELAVRTAVRATVWETIFSIFRR